MSRKSLAVQITAITLVFVGIFFALRTLPSSTCNFLHYNLTQTDSRGMEFCLDDPLFLDFQRMKVPLKTTLDAHQPLEIGKPTEFTIRFETYGGKTVLPHEIALSHTQRVHLLAVDPSLTDYHHVHPQPNGPTGEWTFSITPLKSGKYQIFTEMVPQRTLKSTIGAATFIVPGNPSTPEEQEVYVYRKNGYILQLTPQPTTLKSNQLNHLYLSVASENGQPLTLEPVLAAYAHVVAYDHDLVGFAHLHPNLTGKEQDPLKPTLDFVLNTQKPGHYRIWAQLHITGQDEWFVPFDVIVQPG